MSTTEKPSRQERRAYRQIVRFASETPWAILPSLLWTIRGLIEAHVNGARLSADEIEEAIGPRRGRGGPAVAGAVAVVPLRGVLVPHAGIMVDVSQPGTGLDAWLQAFRSAVADPDVETVLLDVDSPGGSAELVTETAAEVRAARSRKRIVAVSNTMAASAAYAIASQAETFIVTPSGMVGSIGVYSIHEDVSGALEQKGVKPTLIEAPAGGFKTETNPFGPLSDDARAHLQEMVDSFYRTFVDDVAKGRGVDASTVVENFGKGRLLTAQAALQAGLVDGIGSFDQTLARLLAGKPITRGARQEELEPAPLELLPGRMIEPAGESELEPGELVLPAGAIGGFESREIDVDLARDFADADVSDFLDVSTFGEPGVAFATNGGTGGSEITVSITRNTGGNVMGAIDDAAAGEGLVRPAGVLAGSIPFRQTAVVDEPWDGPGMVARCRAERGPLRALHTWVDSEGDPNAKGSYKLPHHQVDESGTPGAANVNGVRAALQRLGDPNTQIPESDKAGCRSHLQRHLDDFNSRSSSSQAAAAVAAGTNEGGTQMETVSFTDGRPPTLEELAAQQDMLRTRQVELNAQAAGRAFTAEEQSEFDELVGEIDRLEIARQNWQARLATIRRQAADPDRQVAIDLSGGGTATVVEDKPGFHTAAPRRIPDNIFDVTAYGKHAGSVGELAERWHDGAKRANELLSYETDSPERTRAFVERMIAKDPSNKEAESFSHRLLMTGNPMYEKAFGKLVMGKPLTTHEEALINMAVSNTGLGSETPVPVTIDPSVILTSDGSVNPLRRLARVVTITGNKWQGIASDGVSVAYEAELTQVADQTPSFEAPSAEVAKAHGWVEFSIEVDQDWGSFRSELSSMFTDARDQKEADKFLNGTGTDEPEGLVYALNLEAGSIVKTDSTGTLALADIEDTAAELPARFDANAVWLANKALYSKVRALANAENSLDVWLQLSASPGQPPNLIGYPAYAASEISKRYTVNHENVAVLGDFGRGFVIVDRIGMNVEIVSLVMGPNNRPKGSRGMYVYFRNTSALVAANAFRMLQIKAT